MNFENIGKKLPSEGEEWKERRERNPERPFVGSFVFEEAFGDNVLKQHHELQLATSSWPKKPKKEQAFRNLMLGLSIKNFHQRLYNKAKHSPVQLRNLFASYFKTDVNITEISTML